MKNTILFIPNFFLWITIGLTGCMLPENSSYTTISPIPTQELTREVESRMFPSYPITEKNDDLLLTASESVLRQFLEHLYQKQCEAAFDLQSIHSERDRDVFMVVCNEGESLSIGSLIEIQPLIQWAAQTKCQGVDEWIQESDTKKAFYLQEQWQIEQESTHTVSFWAELKLADGKWKVSRFHTRPPCNNLEFPGHPESDNEPRDIDYPTTPREVVLAYYKNLNSRECVAAYSLFAENKLNNPWGSMLEYCEFFNFSTWEVKEVLPYTEWVVTNRCNGDIEVDIDEKLRDSDMRKSIYAHIRQIGKPEYIGKVGAGFLQEDTYEQILIIELINSKWKITNISNAFDGGNPCR